MGREEFLTSDNQKRMTTKIVQIRSIDGLKDAKIPEDKLLSDPVPEKAAGKQPSQADGDGFINVSDDVDEELPFM